MNCEEKVSIIMGVYNSNMKQLAKSIESILNQTYDNIELIICNDGSNNGIDNYINNLNDSRIIVIKNDINRGLSYSLNRCLEISSGNYIARQDDDDISDLSRIAKQVDFLENHFEYSLVGTAMWLMDENGIWGEMYMNEIPRKEDLLYGVVHSHPTIMARKSAYNKVNGYCTDNCMRRIEDYDLYVRMYEKGVQGYNLQEKLFYYNQTLYTYKKKKMINRINEVKCRHRVYRQLDMHNPLLYCYLFKPIISGLIPCILKDKIIRKKLEIGNRG